jgi:hypothetical protein
MRLFRMRNSILISFFFISLAPYYFAQGKGTVVVTANGNAEIKWDPVLPDTFHKGLFRMTFDISKNHISGFLLIKKTSDSSTSIVFTNEFGICFFNFEFLDGKFIIHTLFPSFDRKPLLNLLEMDFRLILFPDTTIRKIKVMQHPDTTFSTWKVTSKTGTWEYDVVSQTKKIKEIRKRHAFFMKTILELSQYNADMPGLTSIFHPLQKLKIKLTWLSP